MNDQHNPEKIYVNKQGIAFLPLGIYLFITGIGMAGWVWEGYSSWQPFSFMGTALFSLLIALPIYKKYNISSHSSAEMDGNGLRRMFLFIIIILGIPIISVVTRELSLSIDPLSLFIGLAICVVIYSEYGFDLPLIAFSFVCFVAMFLPSFDQTLIESNHLNENLLESFFYNLKLGLFFIYWGLLSLYRQKQMSGADPLVSPG
jgi:hypothetical protein